MNKKYLITVKGGSWDNTAWGCRSAYSVRGPCGGSSSYVGFRVVLKNKTKIPYQGNSMKPPIFSFSNNLLPSFRAIFDPDNPFIAMGQTPITQRQWREVVERFPDCGLNPNPSYFKGDERPVESVSYDDVVTWIKLLNRILEEEGSEYLADLPTEEEWEYFASAGQKDAIYPTGKTISPELANYGNYYKGTTPVGSFPSNDWELHDFAGNVFEFIKPVEKVKTETEIQIENLQRQLDDLKRNLAEAVK